MLLERLQQFEQLSGMALPGAQALADAAQVRALADGEYAFRSGEACARVFVVRAGLFKLQFVSPGGVARVRAFVPEGGLFACPLALRAGGRASFDSVAIGASLVESVPFAELDALARQHPGWQAALRQAFQRLAEIKIERERELMMLSTTELYAQFLREQPELAQRIPAADMASYLGVTPAGLKRIARRLALATTAR